MQGPGVQGLGVWVLGLGFWGSGVLGFWVQASGFRALGFGHSVIRPTRQSCLYLALFWPVLGRFVAKPGCSLLNKGVSLGG